MYRNVLFFQHEQTRNPIYFWLFAQPSFEQSKKGRQYFFFISFLPFVSDGRLSKSISVRNPLWMPTKPNTNNCKKIARKRTWICLTGTKNPCFLHNPIRPGKKKNATIYQNITKCCEMAFGILLSHLCITYIIRKMKRKLFQNEIKKNEIHSNV